MPLDRVAPTRRPQGRPAGFQRWRRLLFLHWEVPVEAIAASLPEGLEVDCHEGRGLVGVVAFTMRDVTPWWAPPVPGISHFHELNVRTYVVHDGVPGVWFYSLDAAGSVAVVVARAGWSLPYHRARMALDVDGAQVRYSSERLWPGPKPATFEARYRVGGAPTTAREDTLEHFLVERYVLFTQDKRGALLSGRVHHEPYPLHDVALESASESMIAAAGLTKREGEPLVHYSPGVDVDVYALAPVAGAAS